MKIIYAENPMATKIELDDHEKEAYRMAIKLKEFEYLVYDAHWHLADHYDGKYFNLEKARARVDPTRWLSEDDEGPNRLDAHVDMLLEHYIEELAGQHCGDCTCIACSCSKCQAEDRLGIDTIKGLGKHPGHKISSAFHNNQKTCAQVISEWEATPVIETQDWHKEHIERWQKERGHALEWLKAYLPKVGTIEITPPKWDIKR